MPAVFGDLNVVLAYVFGIILICLLGRMLLMPIKIIFRLVYNALIGGAMLWIINYFGAHIGFNIAINPITALIAGLLGLPGVILLILFKVYMG